MESQQADIPVSETLESLSLEPKSGSKEELTKDNETNDAKQKRKLDKIIGKSVLKNQSKSLNLADSKKSRLDNVLKKSNIQSNSIEDKYYALIQKFVDVQEQNKKYQLTCKENERTLANLSKQKDQAQNDYSKMLLSKDKLENLCRELQKHNKLIKV